MLRELRHIVGVDHIRMNELMKASDRMATRLERVGHVGHGVRLDAYDHTLPFVWLRALLPQRGIELASRRFVQCRLAMDRRGATGQRQEGKGYCSKPCHVQSRFHKCAASVR